MVERDKESEKAESVLDMHILRKRGWPHFHKGVVDAGAVGLEEAGARGQAIKEEQLLLRANGAVVTLARFFYAVLVVLHGRLVRECDPIHPLCTMQHFFKACLM